MKFLSIHLKLLIWPLLLLFSGCFQQTIEPEEVVYPESFTIHAIRIDFLGEISPRKAEQWDEDGSGPDLFIEYGDENNRFVTTDIIFDYDFEPNLIIELPVPVTVYRDSVDNGFNYEIKDFDIDPRLPASIQSNDLVHFGGVFPYSRFYTLYRCDQEFYRTSTQGYIRASAGVICN